MEVKTFINNFREAFGESVELPVVFWYSNTPIAETERINGCFFKAFNSLRSGTPMSLSLDVLGCMGGKLYTGFSEMSEYIPPFVSQKERYKQTPEMVSEFIHELSILPAKGKYLNLSPISGINDFDNVVGLIFFATPDVLSGLASWTFFDNNANDTITTKFGSGCSAIIAEATAENARNGRRTFLGLFDPSARPYFEPNVLSFTIPLSRFKEMYLTIRESSLFAHAWGKIRKRINMEQAEVIGG